MTSPTTGKAPLTPATKLILLANITMYGLSLVISLIISGWPDSITLFSFLGPSFKTLSLMGMAQPALLEYGLWWVLVSATFLHSGLIHIAFNLLWARQLAPVLEALLSPYKLIIIWVLSGIAGNWLAMQGAAPVVGASGAVFGILGAIIAAALVRRDALGRDLAKQLGGWAVFLIGFGFIVPNVSNAAHLGGFFMGLGLGFVFPRIDTPKSYKWFRLGAVACALLCAYTFFQVLTNLVIYFSHGS